MPSTFSTDDISRLWARDASLWTNADESKWLGWLDIVERQQANASVFAEVAADARNFSHAVLLGMGGSSLCPEVLSLSFGRAAGFPEMHVLDSTDPAQVLAIESKIDLANTLFIVASKSGSTLEPNIFKQYFYERTGRNGAQFYAITDPGSKMQQVAERDGFRRIFFGDPTIGGRYSALSNFGMIPAAVMGIDTTRFLDNAAAMVKRCKAVHGLNPGLQLGSWLGSNAVAGRDKMTIVASPGIHDLGAWLEQLVAESTGKIGKGIVPVDREPLRGLDGYGDDRVFVYARLTSAPDPAQDKALDLLEISGRPVFRIGVQDAYALGAEFLRWEVATAIAGSIIGINPFDQPDVEASKIETRKLTTEFEEKGSLPAESVIGVDSPELPAALATLLGSIGAGDYFALLGYIEMNAAHEATLQTLRASVLDAKKCATCLGFGPRFLHSTGQAYKGGPNSGVFLQITCDEARDVPVPDQKYTFGVVKAAQARGDLAVLAERGRRYLRVQLGPDVAGDLEKLAAAVARALN